MNNTNYTNTYALTTTTYYNTYCQNYQNIILINTLPKGPLLKFVRRINLPVLSKTNYNVCGNNIKCGLVLGKIMDNVNNIGCKGFNCDYMSPNDIPDLFSFLTTEGYHIDTQITTMMNLGEVKLTNNRLICYIHYNI